MANVVKNFFGLYKIKNRIRRSFAQESGTPAVSRILCCAGKRSMRGSLTDRSRSKLAGQYQT